MTLVPALLRFAAVAAIAAALTLPGCASASALSAADEHALAQLSEIAPFSAELDDDASGTECWAPSTNLIPRSDGGTGDTFRVLCRVHFEEQGTDRFRDVICVGALASNAVTDHCYRWAYYTDAPSYDDQRGHAATPAHPG